MFFNSQAYLIFFSAVFFVYWALPWHRLRVYHDQTEPVIGYYEQRGRLRRVDGCGDAADVGRRLAAAV